MVSYVVENNFNVLLYCFAIKLKQFEFPKLYSEYVHELKKEGITRPFQHIVRLYRGCNLWRDEMKDASPFRQTLTGCEPTLASCLRFRPRYIYIAAINIP